MHFHHSHLHFAYRLWYCPFDSPCSSDHVEVKNFEAVPL